MSELKLELKIENMTCSGCELRIENILKKLNGVLKVKAEYPKARAVITYDSGLVKPADMIAALSGAGYMAKEKHDHTTRTQGWDGIQLAGIAVIILALYVIINNTIGFNFIPEVNQSMGYGVLFVVGLLTSFHCIAMCGGINLSQCVGYRHSSGALKGNMKPAFLYNAGRVLSYTAIGGIAGGIGSTVSFGGGAKGVVAIIAGAFMVIMGINMLNIFPWLQKINPRIPKIFVNKIYDSNGKGPFYVGLLNGFMPCGPLQAMQLYALGTGSAATGALSMFMFSMGTVPLMFGLGTISTMLGKKLTGKLLKASAVLVMFLGIVMVGRGLTLSGINTAYGDSTLTGNVAVVNNGVQVVTIDLEPRSYAPIVVQKDIPVRFVINAAADSLNGCNDAVIIPEFGIEKGLMPGSNTIEFTPDKTGVIPYSCWMGMISSSITVVEDLSLVTPEDVKAAEAGTVTGGGGGGCCGN